MAYILCHRCCNLLSRTVRGIADGLPSWFVSPQKPPHTSPMRASSDVSLEGELKTGQYGVVRSLLRVVEGGTASKALLDIVIDACK